MKNKSFNLVLSIVFFVVGILLFFNPIEQLGYIIRALVLLNLLVALRELIYYIKNSRVFSKMYLINPIVTIIFCILLATQDLFNLGLLIPSFLAFWILMMGILRMITGFLIRKINIYRSNVYILTSIISVFISILILNNPTFFARIIAYTVSFLVIEHAVYQYKIYLKYHDIK
jgi:membrane protein